jgi:hypothetical protein
MPRVDLFSQKRTPKALLVAVLVAAGAAPWATAQYAVDMRANVAPPTAGRTGILNPGVTSLNPYGNYRRPAPPMLGQLSSSGLLGRGMSLRVASPIPSATSFRASLGSSALASFRRDSVAASSPGLNVQTFSQPYFDRSATVPTAGYLQGFVGLGPQAQHSTGVAPLNLRMEARPLYEASDQSLAQGGAGAVGLMPGSAPLPTPQWATVDGAVTSSVFGLEPPRVQVPTEADLYQGRTRPIDALERSLTLNPLDPTQPGAQSDQRRLALPGDAIGDLLSGDLYAGAPGWRQPGMAPGGDFPTEPGLILPPRETGADTAAASPRMPGLPETTLTDPRLLPGADLFNDMRMALALQTDPNAAWFTEMQDIIRAQPELAAEAGARAAEDTTTFLDQMLSTPLKSLVGGSSDAVNDQMLKAESLMEIGHYREAADRYQTASMMDRVNPLPLIGRGHALLAAGDYRTAAFSILQGLQRFPDVARFRFDLQALMGGGEIIDIRRADIMKRLEQREVPELRFLLGYLEYHSGDTQRGLENLERAAEDPRASAIMARYPALLKGESAAPPPRLSEPPAPGVLPADDADAGVEEELVVPPREAP